MKIGKRLIISTLLFVSGFLLKAQPPGASIQELNQKLGRGINMGNMFEAPSETEWGNPFKDDSDEK